MKSTIKNNGTTREINISGQITFRDHEDFFGSFAVIDEGRIKECIVDISDVDFIDSAALGMLLTINDKAGEKGVSFIVKGAVGKVKSILNATKLDTVMNIQ
jgi:stage II sporulation protein AA (anti-sigma F factor antagonist)